MVIEIDVSCHKLPVFPESVFYLYVLYHKIKKFVNTQIKILDVCEKLQYFLRASIYFKGLAISESLFEAFLFLKNRCGVPELSR